MNARIIIAMLLAAMGLAQSASAQCDNGTAYEWTGSSNHEWKNSDNWDPNTGWPGDGNPEVGVDCATIPGVAGDSPIIPAAGLDVRLATLAVVYNDDLQKPGRLDLEDENNGLAVVTLFGRDALKVEHDCVIEIGTLGWLDLRRGGIIELDGLINWTADTDEWFTGATIILRSTNEPYITTGGGTLRGTIDSQHPRPVLFIDGDGVLVLGKDNEINGQVIINVPLVNYGVIDPYYDESPGDHTMWITCEPKAGPGLWSVTGTEANQNTMEIWTPIVGSASLWIGDNGVLKVHRHVSLTGRFIMDPNGEVRVDQEVLLDVDRFYPASCPQ